MFHLTLKRALLALAFSFALPAFATAGNVGLERAREIAADFLSSRGGKVAPQDLELRFDSRPVPFSVSSSEGPEYFIFNRRSGGFAIVSNEAAAPAILAYSFTGSFPSGEIPPALESWLGAVEESAKNLRSADGGGRSFARKTMSIPTKAPMPVVQYETAKWNQLEPFNLKLPLMLSTTTFERVHAVTGCVTTCTAILMRYWKYPERGQGDLMALTYWDKVKTGEGSWSSKTEPDFIPGYSLGHAYDWDHMPLIYDNKSTQQEKEAVATLMRDIAVMLRVHLGTSATSGFLDQSELIQHMGYSSCARRVYVDYYDNRGLVALIKEELDSGRPVPVSGFTIGDTRIGHQYLADGYDDEGNIHINWGWSGRYDGYFTMDYLQTTFPNYFYDMSIITGLQPEDGSTPLPGKIVLINSRLFQLWVEEEPVPGKEFLLSVKYSYDDSPRSLRSTLSEETQRYSLSNLKGYEITAVLEDRNGNVKEYISDPINLSEVFWDIKCTIKGDIAEEDRIKLYFRSAAGQPWIPVLYSYRYKNGEIVLKEKQSNREYSSISVTEGDRNIIFTTKSNTNAVVYDAFGQQLRKGDFDITTNNDYNFILKTGQKNIGRSGYIEPGTYRVVFSRPLDSFEITITVN